MRVNTNLPAHTINAHRNELNRKVVLKLDCILLPFLSLLFLLNSLDKSNLGAAETGNFTRDVGLPDTALNTALATFYIVFVALQPVGAAVGRRIGMARFVPACMALWGLCTVLHVLVTREWQLLSLRVALAILESGFYPTAVSYMSNFYTRYEFARRLGVFYGQFAVAGFVGGLLSWAVFSMFPENKSVGRGEEFPSRQWKAWQVLFVVEGSLTVVVALVGFFWLPHSADTAWFFSQEEKLWARDRISQDHSKPNGEDDAGQSDGVRTPNNAAALPLQDSPADSATPIYVEAAGLLSNYAEAAFSRPRKSSNPSIRAGSRPDIDDRGLSWVDIRAAFLDRKIWYILVANILSAIPATAFSVFLPLVLKGLGSGARTPGLPSTGSTEMAPAMANLLSVPPFVAGACVLWLFTAWSDRTRQRFKPILVGLVIAVLGLAGAATLPKHAHVLRYMALTILLAGSFIPSPLTVAWLSNNVPGPGKRAIVLGINGWGNTAGVLAAMIFSPRYKESGYVVSFAITLLCVTVAACLFWALRNALDHENRRRDQVTSGWGHDLLEREACHGDVFIELPGSPGHDALGGVIGLRSATKETRQEMEQRLTFRYGL